MQIRPNYGTMTIVIPSRLIRMIGSLLVRSFLGIGFRLSLLLYLVLKL
jgi:hypothetical protein